MRVRVAAACAVLGFALGIGGAAADAVPSIDRPRTLVSGLVRPWGLAFLPSGDALLTEAQTRRVFRIAPSGRKTLVATIPGVVDGIDSGLLGIAVSPTFSRDHRVFLYKTTAADNRVVRYTYDGRSFAAPRAIVTGIPNGEIHNGGRLAFGPDRMLYVSTGDTGNGPLAQDRSSLAGKILRVTQSGAQAKGNPFGTRVWTYGHRNVEGMAWDAAGRMWATEFGLDTSDELNLIVAGRNYGWPAVEGTGGAARGFTDPVQTWPVAEASPSGIAFANGSLWVGALRGRRLWQLPVGRDGSLAPAVAHLAGTYGRLRTVVARRGVLWVMTSNSDPINQRQGTDRILVGRPASASVAS